MPENVKTARTCLIVAGCLKLATAGVLLFILIIGSSFVGLSGERYGLLGSALLGTLGFVLFGLAAAVGIVELITAAGVAKGRPWGRVLGILLGVLMLPLFPVGTVLGIFILLGLLGRGAQEWFGAGKSHERMRLASSGPPRGPAGV